MHLAPLIILGGMTLAGSALAGDVSDIPGVREYLQQMSAALAEAIRDLKAIPMFIAGIVAVFVLLTVLWRIPSSASGCRGKRRRSYLNATAGSEQNESTERRQRRQRAEQRLARTVDRQGAEFRATRRPAGVRQSENDLALEMVARQSGKSVEQVRAQVAGSPPDLQHGPPEGRDHPNGFSRRQMPRSHTIFLWTITAFAVIAVLAAVTICIIARLPRTRM